MWCPEVLRNLRAGFEVVLWLKGGAQEMVQNNILPSFHKCCVIHTRHCLGHRRYSDEEQSFIEWFQTFLRQLGLGLNFPACATN